MKSLLSACLLASASSIYPPVFGNPVITAEPRTQFQWENKRVFLNVSATGATPFSYQWQFNAMDILDATNRTFTMIRVQLTNDGNYQVIVHDNTGSVTSQVARVMVRAWPQPTGPSIPELARLDTNMQTIMLANACPGGSLAVVKDGRLVLARGYGFADVENNEPYQPDSLCRSGSLAKTITAATFMHLVEQGKADLDAPVLNTLGLEPPSYPGAVFDSRWTNITARQALNHTAGWDSAAARDPLGAVGFDPDFWPNRIAQDLELDRPARPIDMVRWMLGKPMQFKPGTAFVYSNIGYGVVGTLIETLSGITYEATARQFLAQAGITRMRAAGDARSDRKPGEVVYYLHPSITPSSWFVRYQIEPRPFNFELSYAWPVSLYLAAGGWLISAIEHARFIAAIDGNPSYSDILSTNSVATMVARPKSPSTSSDGYFGLGWDSVNPSSGIWEKSGGDTSWRTYSVKYKNGVILVYTMNTWWEPLAGSPVWSSFAPLLDSIHQWPAHDLFPTTLSYDAWQAKYFSVTELADPTISGDNADPDSDGVSNLFEYASGTDPRVLSEAPRLVTRAGLGDPPIGFIGFRRLPLAHEVEYTIEASEDLIHWSPTGVPDPNLELNPDGTVRAVVFLQKPPISLLAQFFRLRVSRKAQ